MEKKKNSNDTYIKVTKKTHLSSIAHRLASWFENCPSVFLLLEVNRQEATSLTVCQSHLIRGFTYTFACLSE